MTNYPGDRADLNSIVPQNQPSDFDLRRMAYTNLGNIQAFAPNGNAQNQVAIQFGKVPYEDALAMLRWTANVLQAGLEYGNWPWTEVHKS